MSSRSKTNDIHIALIAPIVTPIAQPYVGGLQAMLADLAQGLELIRKPRFWLWIEAASRWFPNKP